MRPYILIGMGPIVQFPNAILGISNNMGCMNALSGKFQI